MTNVKSFWIGVAVGVFAFLFGVAIVADVLSKKEHRRLQDKAAKIVIKTLGRTL